MGDPSLSVVVPFYNNAELLGACLASIAAQTLTDLEVIAVDDGSTDGSAAVAKAVVTADPRFRLIQVPNGGPGSARNHGVAAATGEYLAFVDADDLLPPQAYATLAGVLKQTGSDFISGGVLRLTADGLGASGLHDQAIKLGKRVLSMDYNFFVAQSHGVVVTDPKRRAEIRDQMVDTYLDYFKANYSGNRAPLHIGHHFLDYGAGIYREALKKFARSSAACRKCAARPTPS